MGSLKSRIALQRLGLDIRSARLRRRMTIADMATRAGTSSRTITRLEQGDLGVALGTLADVLMVLGLVERLTDLIDIRKDDLGLALVAESQPKRGRSSATHLRRQRGKEVGGGPVADLIDPDGAAF